MDHDQPSLTARISAFGRALHRELERPIVFDDSLAGAWFTDGERAGFVDNLSRALAFFEPGRTEPTPELAALAMLRGQSLGITLARARFAEDALAPHHAQYVVLGAGLDTFGFRAAGNDAAGNDAAGNDAAGNDAAGNDPAGHDAAGHDPAGHDAAGHDPAGIDVFEVDHPATQRWKRARIAALGWHAPRVRFVEHDFDPAPSGPGDASLARTLDAAGFDRARATHVAWLGVSYYLAPERIPALLAELAALCGPGSSVAFDFIEPAAFEPGTRIARMREATARAAEPMRATLDPGALAHTLRDSGWDLAELLGPAEITARFNYPALPHFWLARATVRA